MRYPKVVNEHETLSLVLHGKSIARFGDGEFSLARGRKCISQVADPRLQNELNEILHTNLKSLLVGIPVMDPNSPKWYFWQKYQQQYPKFLKPGKIYYSQFITRPDSAPQIDNKAFFDALETLWRNANVILVGNGVRSITPAFLYANGANSVSFVQCSYRDSFAQIDNLEKDVLEQARAKNLTRVLLCAGATATCLAYRFAKAGLHAIDLGHIGNHWRPYERLRLVRQQKSGHPQE